MAEALGEDFSKEDSDEDVEIIENEEKRLRSSIYEHFNEEEKSNGQICKYCSKKIKRDQSGSTGNLIRHYNLCRKKPRPDKMVQPKISDVIPKKFVNETFHRLIARHLVLTNQAFQAVESQSFLELQGYGRPTNATVPKAAAIKKLIVKMYDEEKRKLQTDLKEHDGKVSLVVDVWSSKNGFSFHGIIAMWITKEWEFKEALLDLDILEESHSGENLSKSLWKVLEDFEITNLIIAITSDNASNCQTMFENLEQNFQNSGAEFSVENNRIRCLAHICNLACQNAIDVIKKVGLKPVESTTNEEDNTSESMESETSSSGSEDDLENISEARQNGLSLSVYSRLRHTIGKIRNTGGYERKFVKLCDSYKLDRKMLKLDVKTRWYSTFHMLQRALDLQKAIDGTVQAFSPLSNFAVSNDEWCLIRSVVHLLKPFDDVTNEISQAKAPLMSQTAAVYQHLHNHLESTQKKEGQKNSDISDACNAAIIKLNKYYPDSDGLIYILRLILDPRCKLTWYKVAKINPDVIKENKKIALDHWEKFYRPDDDSVEPEERGSDLIARQMKRAKKETRDEFRIYLAEPVVDPNAVKDILK